MSEEINEETQKETEPAEEQKPVDQGDGAGNAEPPADTDPTAE